MNLEKLSETHRERLAASPGVGFERVPGIPELELADRWIFSRLAAATCQVNDALAQYRFHEAAQTVYHFFWHDFCDWYLEWVKPEITGQTNGDPLRPYRGLLAERMAKRPRQMVAVDVVSAPPPVWSNLVRVFEASLHLLHPFMPFITEELWHRLPGASRGASISLESFERVNPSEADPTAEKQFEIVQELIVAARNAKAELGLQKQKPKAQVATEDARLLELFRMHEANILRLAPLSGLEFTRGRLAGEALGVRHAATFDVRLVAEERVNHDAERKRLLKEKEKLERQLEQAKAQLANEQFTERAPREVVRGVEARHAELTEHLRKVNESLERLG